MPSNVRLGSNASVELSWHVGFTPDSGHVSLRGSEPTLRANTGSRKSSGVRCVSLHAPAHNFGRLASGFKSMSPRMMRCDGLHELSCSTSYIALERQWLIGFEEAETCGNAGRAGSAQVRQ
jgi:hypothetical protein